MTSLWRDFDVKEKRKMKHNWGRMWVKGKFLKTGSKESSKKEDSGGKRGTITEQSLGQEYPLEDEMATHSSVLAWRIPRTEEPGGLQSTGSQRVRHD